jgi:hypothetical protein
MKSVQLWIVTGILAPSMPCQQDRYSNMSRYRLAERIVAPIIHVIVSPRASLLQYCHDAPTTSVAMLT